ncbi:hypothetical protein HDU88_007049 [Geranomyces variabilis]|nr:hypothetical protein HDU88_007049 [Geranomyces variabilis]
MYIPGRNGFGIKTAEIGDCEGGRLNMNHTPQHSGAGAAGPSIRKGSKKCQAIEPTKKTDRWVPAPTSVQHSVLEAMPAATTTTMPPPSPSLSYRGQASSSSAAAGPSSSAASPCNAAAVPRPASLQVEIFDMENVESPTSATSLLADPLQLAQRKLSKPDVAALAKKNRKLSEFYERQNDLIDTLLRPPAEIEDEDGEEHRLVKLKIAIYGSLVANICLFALQLVAAVVSGSLALFATTADAFMDLASSLVLIYATRAARGQNAIKYPTGKTRVETAGILVFSIMMGTLSIQLMIEGARTLIGGDHKIDLSPISLGLVAAAIGVKMLLFLYCVTLSQYPSAKILAQDHRNDVVLNAVGITLSILGSKFKWYLDPIGAIVIAVLILRSWAGTALEHIQYIVGKTADPSFLQRVTYIAVTHDPRVLQVDTCRAYHAGHHFFVEVDIVLPPDMIVCEAHDIAEALQNKLETLPNVERAFVHIDYETSHAPEHRKAR